MRGELFQLLHDIGHLKAEIALAIGAMLVLIVGLFKFPEWIVKLVFGLTLGITYFYLSDGGHELFEGAFASSRLALSFLKILLPATLGLLLFPTSKSQRSSYYFLILSALLGSMLMMQSHHFLLIYLSIELASYSSYALSNFSFKKEAHEASLKYLLFGGVSSAVMLFGISMLYGSSGSLFLSSTEIDSIYKQVGMMMFLGGILFKISLAPFHIWVPNVYQTAAADTVTFFSIVPKLAGLILLTNVLGHLQWGGEIILALGILTIVVGTFGAIQQTNVRRLISYGAIAHTGFLLPFVVLDIPTDLFIWYATIYAIMNIGIFYMVAQFEKNGVFDRKDYSGLGKKTALAGVAMSVMLIALIGLPPTAGFTAKWFLFGGLWSIYQAGSNSIVLIYLLVTIFATVIALYYYLRVPYHLFLKEGDRKIDFDLIPKVVSLTIGLILLVLFFMPELI